MIKDTILKQKNEKEQLMSLSYVERTKTAKAKKWIDSDLIKVVLGPRRAGKSVFSLMLLANRPFAYCNFDDESLAGQKISKDELLKELHFAYGETKNILFDEIQNIPQWELFVNRLQRQGYNLILTGSNATLLSKELATALTGRHIPIEIFPFDFQEFLRAKQYKTSSEKLSLPEEKGKRLRLIEEYLQNGGYPEVVFKNFDPRSYLDVLFDSLLFKDVVKRHNVRFSEQIDQLGSYLLNNIASLYSTRKLTNILGFRSNVTLEKYLNYLIESYMVFSLQRYSPKAGERMKSPKKIYTVDNGFINAKAVAHSPDTGKLMENLVYMELIKRGMKPNRDIFYYKTRNNREIDFVIKKGIQVDECIQVAYKTNTPDTQKRGTKALIEATEELKTKKLTILTWDEKRQESKNGLIIHFTPLWEWLTKFPPSL